MDRLLSLDLAAWRNEATMQELEDAVALDNADPELAMLEAVVRAHHFFARGDALCGVVAERALSELMAIERPTPLQYVARGRLWAFQAAGLILSEGAPSKGAADAAFHRAIDDLSCAGYVDFATLHVVIYRSWEALGGVVDPSAALEVVAAAGHRLRARGSNWGRQAPGFLAHVQLISGDEEGFAATAAAGPDGSRFAGSYVAALQSMQRIALDPSWDSLERFQVSLRDFGTYWPELAGDIGLQAVALLIAAHAEEIAQDLMATCRHVPLALPGSRAIRAILEGRLLVLRGDDAQGAARATAGQEALERNGLLRIEDGLSSVAGRAGPDTSSVPASAGTRKSSGGGPSDAVAAGVRIEALGPGIRVIIDGQEHDLGHLHARIVAALLAAEHPVPVDDLCERIWPGADGSAAKTRLATALYRLRSTLGLGRDDVVVREGSWVRLARPDEGVVTDVRELCSAVPSDMIAAETVLFNYRSDFASRTLAYDDVAEDTRRFLRTRAAALAMDVLRHLLDTGEATRAGRLADHLVSVRLMEPPLDELAAEAFRRLGREAEATAVLTTPFEGF